ncbi:MAG: TonB-dependent receptor [Bacteroidota bacterium]
MRYFLLIVFVSIARVILAQEEDYISDSLLLDEVVINDISEEVYAVGTRIKTISAKDRIAEGSSSLANTIAENTSVFFLQYGAAGQLSSINIRGLGPSRSSLLWNGMEINSFSLGQSDYNLIPSSVFNNVSIQYGSAASLYGNGALGGSITLGNDLNDISNNEISISQSIGSFSNYRSSAHIQLINGKLSSSTQGYFQNSENDFPYQLADSTIRQPNAAYKNYGAIQDFLWSVNTNHKISFSGWYNYNFREIQPSRSNVSNQDDLEDENWRTNLTWNYIQGQNKLETSIGYTDDRNLFNGSSEVRTSRWYASVKGEKALDQKLIGFIGANWNRLIANANNYEGQITENRNDIFGGVFYAPLKGVNLTFTARQPIVDGDLKAFSPSLGFESKIFQNDRFTIHTLGNLSRSFRLPTLNDRFWNPGGNLGLNPELSRNAEVGSKLRGRWNDVSLSLEANYFHHLVDNWIIWRPGGSGEDEEGNRISFWFPENLREVRSQGVELNFSWNHKINENLNFQSNLSSTFTKSINLLPLNDLDRSVGKQLPFTPLWNVNLYNSLKWRNYCLGVNYSFTGERFVETNNELDPLPEFSLINLSVASKLDFLGQDIETSFRINNLFKTDYQSFESRAMPGINYEFSLQLIIQ